MLYGIKYDVNKKGLEKANESLERFGSAILTHGKCGLYFTNIISAYLTSRELSKSHNDLKYSVFTHNPKVNGEIAEENIVSSKEEYFKVTEERVQKLLDSLKQSNESYSKE